MPYDETINSSDVEMSSKQASRFGNAGQTSIGHIIEHAMSDRLSSKKVIRELEFTKGSPQIQYMNALWMRRLQSFRSETLNANLDKAPSAEDVQRFLTAILDKVEPKSPHGVPSFSWIKQGIYCLTQSALFRYPDFRLSSHDSLRINTLVDRFVKDGKLTKKPARQRQWIGVTLVKTMTDAVMDDALKNGIINWDVTVRNLLILILTSALQCRAGDIFKGNMDDHELPFLAYGDICLKLANGMQIEHLEALVTIRNEKGAK